MLSDLIKQRRKELGHFPTGILPLIKALWRSFLSDIYLLSPKKIIAIFFITIFIIAILISLESGLTFLLSKTLPQISETVVEGLKILFGEREHFQNLLMTALARISVIIFALVIFVARSLLRNETTDKGRVLLTVSHLFPLVVVTVITFFPIFFKIAIIVPFLLVFCIGLSVVWSLYRIIHVLLNRYLFAQERAKLLADLLKKSINFAIEERIGNDILLSEFLNTSKIKLIYSFISPEDRSKYHLFNALKLGTITDIDLSKLEKIATLIEEKAKEKDYSFTDEKKLETSVGEERNTKETKSKSLTKNNKRYLMKKFNDEVIEDNRTLFYIDKELLGDNLTIKKIEKLLEKTFIIQDADNFAKRVSPEISGVKDQFISAIKNNHSKVIKSLITLYTKLAETFLEQMVKYKVNYTAEEASKERSSYFGRWKEAHWLSFEIRELCDRAAASHDKEIIQQVAYLPVTIARQAIEKNNHYLFQEFIPLTESLYRYAIKEQDEELKKFLIDRSWRHLKEIARFSIEPKLRRDDLKPQEAESLKDFEIYLLPCFQNLLKEAYDNRDLESFKTFRQETKKLFQHLTPNIVSFNIGEIPKQHKYLTNISNIGNIMEWKKYQMYFGLASWILEELCSGKIKEIKEIEKIKQFYELLFSQEISIKSFTQIFLEARKNDVMNFWRWEWWEEREEDKVHRHQFSYMLEKFYVVKSLSLLQNMSDEEIQKIKLPSDKTLAYLAEGDKHLIGILKDIKQNPDKWESVLKKDAINKVASFEKSLSEAQERWEEEERKIKRKKKILPEKVEEFKQEMLKSFYGSAHMRDIFIKYLKAYKDETKKEVVGKQGRFGINQVDDKAAFLDEENVDWIHWYKSHGQNIGYGENYALFSDIAKLCKEIPQENFDATLLKFEQPDNLFILATTGESVDFIDIRKNFKHNLWSELKGLIGEYSLTGIPIPVFCAPFHQSEEQILILNKEKIGDLVQLSPFNKGEKQEFKEKIFYMNIRSYSENEELMKKLIKEAPKWLKEKGDEEQQREYLKERVLIQIFERFEFEKADDFEGYKVIIKKQ